MTDLNILTREEPRGLGLGWLLVIALGGGALLFVAIGLLLAWRVNHHREPCTTTVYARSIDDLRGLSTRLTKRRLTESTTALPTAFSSRLSLTMPPVLPPLPTYNSFNFFRAPSNRRRQSQAWGDDDDDDDGLAPPKPRKSLREKRFSRDGWFGRVRTLPNLATAEQGEAVEMQPQPEHAHRQQSQPMAPPTTTQDIEVQKRHHARTHSDPVSARPGMHTRPDHHVPAPPPPLRDRAWVVPGHANSWQADTDLRDILRSTEERLRERSHGPSPVKTPRSSPAKTPRSCRTGSSRAGRSTPSPTKRGDGMSTPSTTTTVANCQAMLGRDASAASIGSVADSLIAQATQELQLPGGLSSPSRLRGQEWESRGEDEWQSQLSPMRSPQRSPQRSPERPRSRDSDASSSLSTLYSVGEPEEGREQHHAQQQQHQEQQRQGPDETGMGAAAAASQPSRQDPFAGNGPYPAPSWQSKAQLSGPRPLRRIKTISPRSMQKRTQTSPAAGVKPLRPISANSLHALCRDSERATTSGRRWPVLPPPPPPPPPMPKPKSRRASSSTSSSSSGEEAASKEDEAGPRKQPQQRPPGVTCAASESSFTTDSVHSASDSDSDATQMPTCETPRREWLHGSDRRGPSTVSPATPPRRHSAASSTSSAASSSPYNEHDILTLLLSTSAPRRALPRPPTMVTAPDGSVVATPLSPRPRDGRTGGAPLAAEQRRGSPSSSSCSMAPSVSVSGSGSPSKRPTSRFPRDREQQAQNTLGNTIAELRRMNSMVSSYSAASVASTAVGGVEVADSPTLPGLFGGVAGLSSVSASQVQPRPMPRPGAIGSRHYLNIGNSPSKHRPHHRKSASADSRPSAAPRPASDRDRLLLQHQHRRESGGAGAAGVGAKEQQRDKENQGLEVLKDPCADAGPPPVPGRKNPRRSAHRSREMLVPLTGSCTAPLPHATAYTPAAAAGAKQKPAAGPVKNLAFAFEKRIADGRQGRVDGHGRRDRDGSPATVSSDGESRKRCLRM